MRLSLVAQSIPIRGAKMITLIYAGRIPGIRNSVSERFYVLTQELRIFKYYSRMG
jgi:hypothetical protein